MKKQKLQAISLFSGAGGMDIGVQDACVRGQVLLFDIFRSFPAVERVIPIHPIFSDKLSFLVYVENRNCSITPGDSAWIPAFAVMTLLTTCLFFCHSDDESAGTAHVITANIPDIEHFLDDFMTRKGVIK